VSFLSWFSAWPHEAKMSETAQIAPEEFAGTMPVREQHRFDLAALDAWMRANVAGFRGALTVEQFKGGQSNPTYRVTAGEQRYVLRRKPPGKLLPSAHAVDREFRIMSALAATDMPVPRMHALCMDDGVIGTAFYVMEYVAGRSFWEPTLPALPQADRRGIFAAMNDAIARLHKVDYAAIGLSDYGRPGSYVLRQIDRWSKQYRASETEAIPAMDRLMEWLPRHAPASEETTLIHGDFRIDNLIFHPNEPRVIAVLDWELSTLGNPLSDFAYHMMPWRLGPDTYRGLFGYDLAALGIPSEAEGCALYCRRTGRSELPDWDFYIAFNMFRLAAILQGIMGRVREGTAASARAQESGARAKRLAEAGWAQVEALEKRR
jgi:aminoglycoside phosphotransferase (APT) family kinase protein